MVNMVVEARVTELGRKDTMAGRGAEVELTVVAVEEARAEAGRVVEVDLTGAVIKVLAEEVWVRVKPLGRHFRRNTADG